MDPAIIQRYQPGGDLYAKAQAKYGTAGANRIAAAAATGNQAALNDVFAQLAGDGTARNDSTWSILGTQLATDPLAAPLEDANTLIGNSVFSFLKNPWVVVAVVVIVFGAMGGFGWLGKKVFKG